MRIPFINSDQDLHGQVVEAFQILTAQLAAEGSEDTGYHAVAIEDGLSAIEHINYQTPPLIMINFADNGFDAFEIMNQIVADPWLNNGAIIAIYDGSETLERINNLQETNIIISLPPYEIKALLLKVLKVVRDNRHILFQRAIQTDLIANLSGRFQLEPDILIIPCYANLVANYLYNMGFVDAAAKSAIGLTLTELLINAIEHGNCGITAQEKTDYLNEHGAIHGLIAERCARPEVSAKRVLFHYEIGGGQSRYLIADEGDGFNWQEYLDPEREIDPLAFHGRGIMLSMHSVTALEYNEKGNEVRVTMEHRTNTTNTVPLVFRDQTPLETQPGDVVFRQGEESDFLYYIAEGEFRVELNGKPIATITPADILMGEMSFLLQESRSATVIASTPGRLIKISNMAFVNSIKNQPYYGLFLAKLLAQKLFRLGRTFAN